MKITEKKLIDNGYTKYPPSPLDKCTYLYQKAIRNPNSNKLYFINIMFYDYSKLKVIEINENWASNVQYTMNEDDTVNVEFHIGTDTELEKVEEFYAEFYKKFNCTPYDDHY